MVRQVTVTGRLARAHIVVLGTLALLAALLPATAQGRLQPIAVHYPVAPIAGTMLEVTFRVPKSIGDDVAHARLERRKADRWVPIARSNARAGRTVTLRFTAPPEEAVVLRLQLRLRGKVVAASRTVTLRLRARSSTGAPARGTDSAGPPSGQVGSPAGQLVPSGTVPFPGSGQPHFSLVGGNVVIAPGSVAAIDLPVPLESVSSLGPVAGLPAGIEVTEQAGGLVLVADSSVPPGSTVLDLTGTGCLASQCETEFTLELPTTVRSLAAPPGYLEEFTSPSPDRIDAGTPIDAGGVELRDQVNVTLGTPDVVGSRAEAESVAAQVDGFVSAGLEDLGVFEIRWETPQDIDARIAQIEALPGVSAVSRVTPGLTATDAEPPGDWDDDGPQATWPYTQVHAQQAWETTTGSNVTVGIVDGGLVYRKHEDLNVVQSIGGGDAAGHATHVAGLACAKANGIGIVGMAWGCPIVTSGSGDRSPGAVLAAARKVALAGARVINISMGFEYGKFCHTVTQQNKLLEIAAEHKEEFRQLFQGSIGSEVVWTVSAANNCAEGVPSPWGLNADLPNVIAVASTNDGGDLSSFSDFGDGIELAAPGGVSAGDVGLWSTWVEGCALFLTCGSYETLWGTSMAAPVVAGIAALVRDAHPRYTAAATAACLTQTAGNGVGWAATRSDRPAVRHPIVPFSSAQDQMPIVNAEAAVACTNFDSEQAGSYVGSWAGGGWLLDVYEESDGVLAAINQSSTSFPNGCVIGPGLKLMSGVTSGGDGQWNGYVVGAPPSCSPVIYQGPLALRAVRLDGEIALMLAWAQSPSGTLPAIDADGDVVSSTPYYSLWLTRPGGQGFASGGQAGSDGAVTTTPGGRAGAAGDGSGMATPIPRPG